MSKKEMIEKLEKMDQEKEIKVLTYKLSGEEVQMTCKVANVLSGLKNPRMTNVAFESLKMKIED